MLKAKDFRRYARESLKGRWVEAGGVGLLAGLLGASISTSIPSGSSSGATETSELMSTNMSGAVTTSPEIPAMLFAIILGVALVALIWAIVILVIGGATTLGYAKYNLNLVDDNEPKLHDVFSQYNRLGTGFGMQFFRGVFVFLWSLLLVIPGIIAIYSYYMTPYILCENPEMTAREAIRESKELMKGNKWRLFCLEFSFIGWEILAAVCLVAIMALFMPTIGVLADEFVYIFTLICMVVAAIGCFIVIGLTLKPYIETSIAVFYREISEERYSNPKNMIDSEWVEKESFNNHFYETIE